MKAKLIHRGNGDYKLYVNGATYAQSAPNPHRKLSKQNCDEIFGVIDVEKIADRHTFGQRNHEWKAYVEGFNKAVELNKDKVFTIEDMHDAVMLGVCFENPGIQGISNYNEAKDLAIKRALKPTEIEVEIEMEWITAKTFCDTCNKVMYPDYRCEDKTCFNWQPKLDS